MSRILGHLPPRTPHGRKAGAARARVPARRTNWLVVVTDAEGRSYQSRRLLTAARGEPRFKLVR